MTRTHSSNIVLNRLLLLMVGGVLLLGAMGCSPKLMRAPVMFDRTTADPFATLPTPRRNTQSTIFYATDRDAHQVKGETVYNRGRAPALVLGKVGVTVGENLTWGHLIQNTLGSTKHKRPVVHFDPPKPFGLLLTTAPPRVIQETLSGQGDDGPNTIHTRFVPRTDPGRGAFRFAKALNAEMDATAHQEIYVYVHGYYNTFDNAIETAANLHHYNGRHGAVIAFAWPSQKHLWDYAQDRESATYAVTDLRDLLIFLADHTEAQKIHIIAHSMGTFLTSNTLREMRLIGYTETPEALRERFRLGDIVLVAPDIDVDVLQKRFFREGFEQVAERLTMYVSPDDQALNWATRLLFGIVRAGSVTGNYLTKVQRLWLKAHPNVAMIDISGQKTYGIGHSHHTQNPGVASDLLLLLAHHQSPAQRGLSYVAETGVWTFPKHYTQRVKAIAQEAYPEREKAAARE
ncbi:MAG: alpha/beta fold hydrolase [Algisphaera sp.]